METVSYFCVAISDGTGSANPNLASTDLGGQDDLAGGECGVMVYVVYDESGAFYVAIFWLKKIVIVAAGETEKCFVHPHWVESTPRLFKQARAVVPSVGNVASLGFMG